RLQGARRRKAEIEHDVRLAGNHVACAGAGVDIGDLPGRGGKVFVAVVPFRLRELGEGGRDFVHRILCEVRVGDVTLYALHHEMAWERAAPAVLDHVAESADAGRLTDDAVVYPHAAGFQRFDYAHRPIDRRPFLVRGEKDRDRAGVVGMCGYEACYG